MNNLQKKLQAIFLYDPDTGVLIRRATNKVCGVQKSKRRSHQVGIDGKKKTTSHVIWAWMTGDWPTHEIDHEDRNHGNFKWNNLREATRSQNCMNCKKPKNSFTSKYKGVKIRHGRYYAFVTANGVNHNAGYYDNEIEAGLAADQLLKTHHKEFAVLNFPEEETHT